MTDHEPGSPLDELLNILYPGTLDIKFGKNVTVNDLLHAQKQVKAGKGRLVTDVDSHLTR